MPNTINNGIRHFILLMQHIKTLSSHTGYVYALLVLSDGSLVSCSYDKTIKIWKYCINLIYSLAEATLIDWYFCHLYID